MTDSETINMARARKIRISKLVSTAIPIAVLAVPGTAFAQQAVNTATITAPTGAIESNSSNNSATDTDNVLARIVVTNDSTSGQFGTAGATAVLNVLGNDTFNTGAATIADVTLSVASSSSLPAQLTFDPSTGDVGVVAGTSEGTYSFFYTICETANPTNCLNAEVAVTVVAPEILADADSATGVNGASGATGVVDVLDGDTLNGSQATLADVDISVITAATPNTAGDPVPTLDQATGLVDVPAGTPAGTYTITYQICETLNPTNCSQNTVTIVVAPSVDLSITKDNGVTTVRSGDTITYSITVSNAGPDAATGAVLADAPGAGITCPTSNPLSFANDGIPAGGPFTFGDLQSGITLGTIPSGGSLTVTYDCTVD